MGRRRQNKVESKDAEAMFLNSTSRAAVSAVSFVSRV
jgi:hypothetical protein